LSITVRSQSEPLANRVGVAQESIRSPLTPPWSLSRCSAIGAWCAVKSTERTVTPIVSAPQPERNSTCSRPRQGPAVVCPGRSARASLFDLYDSRRGRPVRRPDQGCRGARHGPVEPAQGGGGGRAGGGTAAPR